MVLLDTFVYGLRHPATRLDPNASPVAAQGGQLQRPRVSLARVPQCVRFARCARDYDPHFDPN